MSEIRAVVFDVGNVLVRWNPEHLYATLIPDAAERAWFLGNVCSPAWNLELDRGGSWEEAIAERCAAFPDQAQRIRAYRERWDEMVPGALDETVEILENLCQRGVPCYALTNFSSEMFQRTLRRFPFFGLLQGMVVSSEEGMVKPDARLYRCLVERYSLEPSTLFFIDDTEANVEAARRCGWQAHRFIDAKTLRQTLLERMKS